MKHVETFTAGTPVPYWLLDLPREARKRGWGLTFGATCHVLEIEAGYYVVPAVPHLVSQMFRIAGGYGPSPAMKAGKRPTFWAVEFTELDVPRAPIPDPAPGLRVQ